MPLCVLQPAEEGERQAAVTSRTRCRTWELFSSVATEEQKRPSGLSENSSSIRFLITVKDSFFSFFYPLFFTLDFLSQDIHISGHDQCVASSDDIIQTPAWQASLRCFIFILFLFL